MKKYFYIIAFLFFFLLSGCEKATEEVSETLYKTYNVNDMKDTSNVDQTMSLYTVGEDGDIFYIQINELIDVFFSENNQYVYKFENDEFYIRSAFDSDLYLYKFNPDTNTITTTDNQFIMDTTRTMTSVNGHKLSSGEETVQIDLDDYGYDIVRNENNYYIPLSVANIFLSHGGSRFFVKDNELYRTYHDSTTIDILERLEEQEFEDKYIIKDTVNSLALLFDYYYGLKDYYHIASFRNEFSDYGLYDVETLTELGIKIKTYFAELDDIHTSIITYGYDANTVRTAHIDYHERTQRYFDANHDAICSSIDDKVRLSEVDETYILTINGFNDNTISAIERALYYINPNYPIIINLSCNHGGYLSVSQETLGYFMENISPYIIRNAQTGQIYESEYIENDLKQIENPVYIYTSNATFSAANLFTSQLKDQNNMFVFGETTLGGGATVSRFVLPNNMMISYSTNYLILNEDSQMIESGITPDVSVVSSEPSDAYNEVINTFKKATKFYVNDESTLDNILISFAADSSSEYEVTAYHTRVYNNISEQLLLEEKSNTNNFFILHQLPDNEDDLLIQISTTIILEGKEKEIIIYNRKIDDFPDNLYEVKESVDFNTQYTATKTDLYDQDIIRFDVVEYGLYRVELNIYDSHSVLYDENGNEIGKGINFILNPGTYYVELDHSLIYDGDYTFRVDAAYDDNKNNTNVLLAEGENNFLFDLDYEGDTEGVIFTLEDDALIHLLNNDVYYVSGYSLYKVTNNERQTIIDGRALHEESFILPAGTYVLEYIGMYRGLYNCTVILSHVTNDYSGTLDMIDGTYGELVEGDNVITFNGKWDQDIYSITVTETTDITFLSPDVSVYHLEDEVTYVYSGTPLTLTPGTHWFLFRDRYGSETDVEIVNVSLTENK